MNLVTLTSKCLTSDVYTTPFISVGYNFFIDSRFYFVTLKNQENSLPSLFEYD